MLKFPEYAQKCIDTITNNGHEAYFVGGCVRDGLLGRACYDIDIATSALPDEIISMFDRTIPTGLKHGTVTVIIDDLPIEVTTYRQESGYNDSRHPDSVSFVSNIEEDLSRRDFTINALAASGDGKILDVFGGKDDLKHKIIKAVGNPQKRFTEDALRIVRAYRFSSVLGFEIEEKTKKFALDLSSRIEKISGERVLKELYKAAVGSNISALCELISVGALSCFGIQGINLDSSYFTHLSALKLDESSKLALLILACKYDINLIKFSLKADNQIIKKITSISNMLELKIPQNKAEIKKLLYKFDAEYVELYLYYLEAASLVSDKILFNILHDIYAQQEAYKIHHLSIDGNDILALGVRGADVKNLLEKALFAVIEEKIPNSKEALINFLKN